MDFNKQEVLDWLKLFEYEANDGAGYIPEWRALYKNAKQTAILIDEATTLSLGSGLLSVSAFCIGFSRLKESREIVQVRNPEPPEAPEFILTAEQYARLPAREVTSRYQSDRAFRAGVDKLIEDGKI